jgi:hypothetical protein
LFISSGKNCNEAIDVLKQIEANFTASLLEKAVKIYKNGPTNDGRNESELDELTEEQEDNLSELDDAFYMYNDNLSDLQIKFIKENLVDF